MGKATERRDRGHNFVLLLGGVEDLTTEVEDALFEAGCDDALLGMRNGRAFLDFDREAPTLKDAILSAIADVRKADIGAVVVRVDGPAGDGDDARVVAMVNNLLESSRLRREDGALFDELAGAVAR